MILALRVIGSLLVLPTAAAMWIGLSALYETLIDVAVWDEFDVDQAALSILAGVLHLSWQAFAGAALTLLCFAAARLLEAGR